MKSKREKLTQARLKELLDYDPDAGIFTWKNPISTAVKVGQEAGSLSSYGYIIISLSGKKYRAHRLAFLWMDGYVPENEVDHIDKIKTNNKWKNLREVSKQCNARNCGNRSTNTSGVRGVSFDKINKKWYASIRTNYKHKNLGLYDYFDEAVCARLAAEQCLNWSGCDSNSPAYQHVKGMIKSNPYS